MDFQLRCGNCKEQWLFDKLKRDDFSKKYHWVTLVSYQSWKFIHYYCSSCDNKKSRQQSYTYFLLKSRVCRHDMTYRNNDKEFIFERDSDEVSNN